MSVRNWTKTLKEELGSAGVAFFQRNKRSFIETGKIKGTFDIMTRPLE
jgi:hypothetical protein